VPGASLAFTTLVDVLVGVVAGALVLLAVRAVRALRSNRPQPPERTE
jgi:hypothetical protein